VGVARPARAAPGRLHDTLVPVVAGGLGVVGQPHVLAAHQDGVRRAVREALDRLLLVGPAAAAGQVGPVGVVDVDVDGVVGHRPQDAGGGDAGPAHAGVDEQLDDDGGGGVGALSARGGGLDLVVVVLLDEGEDLEAPRAREVGHVVAVG